jgi:hypothetical protein
MNHSILNSAWLWVVFLMIGPELDAQSDTAQIHSQFLFPEFSNTLVLLKGGKTQNVIMNYNILSEKMVFKQGNDLMDLINPESIDTIFLQNEKFIPYGSYFLEVYPESKIPLYFQYKGNLKMPGKPAAYGGTSETSSSSTISTFFNGSNSYNLSLPSDYKVKRFLINWVQVDGEMRKFLTANQFLKIFKRNEPELKQFIKSNKINFSKRDDILRLMTFCNGL